MRHGRTVTSRRRESAVARVAMPAHCHGENGMPGPKSACADRWDDNRIALFAGRGLRVHLARAVDWRCGLADGRPQLRTRWIGWRREEQFRRLPGTTRGLLFLVVVSGPRLRCRGWCGGDREAAVACCGVVCLADEVQRHHVQGGEPGVRWQGPCARQRAPTGEAKDPYVFPLRRDAGSFAASCGVGVAGAAGRRRSCARFISTSGRFPARAGASPRCCA